jgi:hypothetical protein
MSKKSKANELIAPRPNKRKAEILKAKFGEDIDGRLKHLAALTKEVEALRPIVAKLLAEDTSELIAPRPNKRKRGRPTGTLGLKKRTLIDAAYAFLENEHPAQGRSVGYHLFNNKFIASMSEIDLVYGALGDARERGLIPWGWVTDETRPLEREPQWDDPKEFLVNTFSQYRKDFWQHQPRTIEVWVEKAGRIGAIKPVLDEYGVPYIAVGGFASKDMVHLAAERIARSKKPFTILYLGDYDPCGMCMSELDLPERLGRYGAGKYQLVRVALTKPDTQTGLTSFPAATKGPRWDPIKKRHVKGDAMYSWFIKNYGKLCWELDAMLPSVMRAKLTAAIRSRLDLDAWDRCEDVAAAEQKSLGDFLETYPLNRNQQEA